LIIILLILTGFVAGFINTLAGGGSILSLPVLILAGIPSPVANATNRVAILLQNIIGTNRFYKHNKLEIAPVIHITIAAIIGSIAGSFLAANIRSTDFDIILGIILVFILILMLRPRKQLRADFKKIPSWLEFLIFLVVGFYGGFIQVGIGFILLATLNLVENYELVRANAVKVFIVLSYTIFAVIIFAMNGKIIWKYGLILAIGNMLGAYVGVKAAIKGGERTVKLVLSVAILIACLKLFGLFALIGL
jgi:uncharacterized protein